MRSPNYQKHRDEAADNETFVSMLDITQERDELLACMRRAQKMLEVPAAEYVPAINDAWEELQRGLQG